MTKYLEIDILKKEFVDLMIANKLVESKSAWRRLVDQNAIKLIEFNDESCVFKIGKTRFTRLRFKK